MGMAGLVMAIFTGIALPPLQLFIYKLSMAVPPSSTLAQPRITVPILLLLNGLPALIFVTGMARAGIVAGGLGIGIYMLITIATNSLFQTPVQAIMMVLSVVVVGTIALALRQLRRGGGRGVSRRYP